MMKNFFILIFTLSLGFVATAQEDQKIDYSTDTDSIQHIIDAFYDVITGEAGQRDWQRFRNLFTEDASLNAKIFDQKGKPQYIIGTAEDYIKGVDEYFTQNGFYEIELGRKQMQYTDIANVFSAFESKLSADGPVYQRGINAIQLVFTDGRWYIANLIYNTEKKTEPIPSEYLNFN